MVFEVEKTVNLPVFAHFSEEKPIFLLKITDFHTSIPHTFHKFVSQNRKQATAHPNTCNGMSWTAKAIYINNVIFKL